MNRPYRVAVFCGIFPIIVGVSIFLLWLITRWQWLMIAGVFTLCGGVALFLIGVVSLACSYRLAVHNPDVPRRRLWLSTLGCGGLLLSNFLAAGGISVAAIAIETSYTVMINNATEQPLGDVRISGGGCNVAFGSISPGSSARLRFWIQQDGELEFHAVSGTSIYTKNIDGYVTHNMGGHTTVEVNPDGSISVSTWNR